MARRNLGLVPTNKKGICRYEEVKDGNRRQMGREVRRVRCRPAGKRGYVVDYRNFENPHIDEKPPGKYGPIRGGGKRTSEARAKSRAKLERDRTRAPARRSTTKKAAPKKATPRANVRTYKTKKGTWVIERKKAGGLTCRTFKTKMFMGGKDPKCREVCYKGGKMVSNEAARGCK